MAFVAVNKNGDELISGTILFRAEYALETLIEAYDKYEMYKEKCVDIWANSYSEGYFNVPRFNGVILPKGTIKKLIGFDLKWEDDPIELT